jgi:hypothetical protein
MKKMNNNKQLVEEATDLAKGVKVLVKDLKEMTDLVCHMRKMLETCMVEKNGIYEMVDYDSKKLVRAFEIMMEVQHEKDLLRELKQQGKTENLHVEGEPYVYDVQDSPTIDDFYGDEEV